MAEQRRNTNHPTTDDMEDNIRPASSAGSLATIASHELLPTVSPANTVPEDLDLGVIRSFRVDVPRQLSWRDVCSLIVNKMIGTGIFTGPPTVLSYTGNKRIAIALWVLGFFYTLFSMILYLEYARKLPYTGGELIYLDAVMPGPSLLSYTIYAFYFVLIYNTATNSMQFARQVIFAAINDQVIPDQRVLRLIAVVITSLVCLVLYFSTTTSRRLNRYTAYAKIVMLFSVFVAGGVMAGQNGAGFLNVPPHLDSSAPPQTSSSSSAVALLQILFAFQGWENATLVAGEVPDNRTLRRGFISAIWIVGLLYLLINIVYCYAIPWNSDGSVDAQFVALFFGNSSRAQVAWAVLIAMSAFGSMISVTYTAVRVKQTIGWCNIIPWSNFWRSSAPVRSANSQLGIGLQPLNPHAQPLANDLHVLRTGTPQGGIVLHWISCVFFICVTTTIRNDKEATSFEASPLIYGHAIISVFVGLMFPRFAKRNIQVPAMRGWRSGNLPPWLSSRLVQWLFGGIYAAFSMVVLVMTALGPSVNDDGTEREVKNWVSPVVILPIFAFSILYYIAFLASTHWTGVRAAGVTLTRKVHGVDDRNLRSLHRKCDLCDDSDGTAHRHSRDGYETFLELHFPDPEQGRSFLYWFFGGPNERHYPDFRLDDTFQACRDWIGSLFGTVWKGVNRFLRMEKNNAHN